MKETKKIIMSDYKNVADTMSLVEPDSENYQALLESKDKIRNELIKIDQLISDSENKQDLMAAEKERDRIRNTITIAFQALSMIIGIWSFKRTLRFDEHSTPTGTTSRNIINEMVLKMFRK